MADPTPVPDDVRRWLDAQPAAERAALEQAWALAALADPAPPAAAPATDDAWAALSARLDDAPAAPAARRAPDRGPARAPTRSPRRMRLATVATLLAAAAVAVAVWWPRATTLEATGGVLVAALPDGSEVTLAPGSSLRYEGDLSGDVRAVELVGQGHFDVASAPRPFVVETFNATVEVLGTVFDVSAWPGAPETAVALEEGSVRLRSAAGAVVLAPGQVSRVSGAGAPTPPVRADVSAVGAWRAGGFAVVDAPLRGVAAALAARYGAPVRLGPGVDGGRRLTLYLPAADSAEVVLRDLAAYLDLRLQSGPDGLALLAR